MKREFEQFVAFIKKQGVPGLAVGFIIGGAVSKVVASLVNDIINPLVGLGLGVVGNLSEQYLVLGKSKIGWGNFVSVIVDFVIIALVVYYGVKLLQLDQPAKEKETKEKVKEVEKKK